MGTQQEEAQQEATPTGTSCGVRFLPIVLLESSAAAFAWVLGSQVGAGAPAVPQAEPWNRVHVAAAPETSHSAGLVILVLLSSSTPIGCTGTWLPHPSQG